MSEKFIIPSQYNYYIIWYYFIIWCIIILVLYLFVDINSKYVFVYPYIISIYLLFIYCALFSIKIHFSFVIISYLINRWSNWYYKQIFVYPYIIFKLHYILIICFWISNSIYILRIFSIFNLYTIFKLWPDPKFIKVWAACVVIQLAY